MRWASKSRMAPATYHRASVRQWNKLTKFKKTTPESLEWISRSLNPRMDETPFFLTCAVVVVILLISQLITNPHTSMSIVSRLPSPVPTVCIRHYTERNDESIPRTVRRGQRCQSENKSTYYPFSPMLKNNSKFVRFLSNIPCVIEFSNVIEILTRDHMNWWIPFRRNQKKCTRGSQSWTNTPHHGSLP